MQDAEMKTDRLLEYQILKQWNELKRERKTAGFTSTNLRISVKMKETSKKDVNLIFS